MFEFLGKESVTLLEMSKNYDEFQSHKISWLGGNKEYSEATKRTYWVLMNKNVWVTEKEKNKDLYDFTNEEIEEMLSKSSNMKTITILKSIISNYINWAIERGYKLKQNPDGTFDKEKYYSSMRIQMNIQYKTLDEFYEMLEELRCSDVDKMLLVLARYGVIGEKLSAISNLRWEDIDKKNMIVNAGDNIKLPIDNMFIAYLERAKKCETYEYQTSTLRYIDYGYVVKVSDKSDRHIANFNTIYNRANSIFKNNGINRIAFGDFVAWRMFDLLFEIVKEKGEITYDDVKSVFTTVKGKVTMSQAQYLKERFMILKEYREYLNSRI